MPIASDIVLAISQRLAERAGLELPAWVVEARAAARIDALSLTPAQYVSLIESGRGTPELDELIEAVRVGETRLFRHRAQIAALCDDIVPALRASGKRVVRVWSAGCAGGEEPYTLAVVLSRLLPNIQLQITATDVSADALAAAATGLYRSTALADVPEPWRDDFIATSGDAGDGDFIRVRPELAQLVRFERANLVEGNAPRSCDIVWCRNVLIYFTPEARRRAIEKLVAATNVGGYIFVGYSESLRDFPILDAVRAGDAVYYVKRAAPAPSPPPRLTPATGLPRVADSGMWRVSQHTPPPTRIPVAPPTEDTLFLRGEPAARHVTAELTARLAIIGLMKLVVDLDAADMLSDDLVPVFRRARAAAMAAQVSLELRATRPGTKRWLARHNLEEAP